MQEKATWLTQMIGQENDKIKREGKKKERKKTKTNK